MVVAKGRAAYFVVERRYLFSRLQLVLLSCISSVSWLNFFRRRRESVNRSHRSSELKYLVALSVFHLGLIRGFDLLWLWPKAALRISWLRTFCLSGSQVLLSAGVLFTTYLALPPPGSAAEMHAKLLIAYTSFRERSRHPVVYFYEHDGDAHGKIVGKITPANKRSDHHPALAMDGQACCFAAEDEGKISVIRYWDVAKEALVELPLLNGTPNTQMAPAFASRTGLLCFESWNRPGVAGRWDLMLYDIKAQQVAETLKLNTSRGDERKPAISSDGRWIAYTTNAAADASLTDILLFDRKASRTITPTKLNSAFTDTEPSLDADGRLLAFVSDRPASAPAPSGTRSPSGTRNVYLYDRVAERLLALPGLNSLGQEQSPAISPNGRYLAFVSERLDGAGERDIYLYDRQTERLLLTPGLNSTRDEYDPCIVVLSE